MSLTEKRLMFFRAFNSLLGSVGANFCHVVLNIIIVKYKQSLFLWTARWIGATISLKMHIIEHSTQNEINCAVMKGYWTSIPPDGIPWYWGSPRFIIPSLLIPRYFSYTGIPRIPCQMRQIGWSAPTQPGFQSPASELCQPRPWEWPFLLEGWLKIRKRIVFC